MQNFVKRLRLIKLKTRFVLTTDKSAVNDVAYARGGELVLIVSPVSAPRRKWKLLLRKLPSARLRQFGGHGPVEPSSIRSVARRLHSKGACCLEFCLVDERGFLVNLNTPDDGWLCGSTNERMCWITPSLSGRLVAA
jgi:hypothetical protein